MSAFVRKLEHGASLTDADRDLLRETVGRTKKIGKSRLNS